MFYSTSDLVQKTGDTTNISKTYFDGESRKNSFYYSKLGIIAMSKIYVQMQFLYNGYKLRKKLQRVQIYNKTLKELENNWIKKIYQLPK